MFANSAIVVFGALKINIKTGCIFLSRLRIAKVLLTFVVAIFYCIYIGVIQDLRSWG